METPIRPGSFHNEEARKTLASILNLLQKDRALGERALRLWAAMHGLDPEEALTLAQSGRPPPLRRPPLPRPRRLHPPLPGAPSRRALLRCNIQFLSP